MNINFFAILCLVFLGLLTSEMSFSQTKVCDKPIYTVCSVTVNTKHEIQTLREFLTGNIEGTTSTDGCIAFHEFVQNGRATTREMLEFVPGGKDAPKTTCSVLMISGHHDMYDMSCTTTNTQGVCDRRNSIIYSDDFNDNKISPSGSLLNLAALSRSNAVCPDFTSTRPLTKSYSG